AAPDEAENRQHGLPAGVVTVFPAALDELEEPLERLFEALLHGQATREPVERVEIARSLLQFGAARRLAARVGAPLEEAERVEEVLRCLVFVARGPDLRDVVADDLCFAGRPREAGEPEMGARVLGIGFQGLAQDLAGARPIALGEPLLG